MNGYQVFYRPVLLLQKGTYTLVYRLAYKPLYKYTSVYILSLLSPKKNFRLKSKSIHHHLILGEITRKKIRKGSRKLVFLFFFIFSNKWNVFLYLFTIFKIFNLKLFFQRENFSESFCV